MTILKYWQIITLIMQHLVLENDKIQSKPRSQRQVTYFCRLCREYGVKTRKAHLQNYHNASRDTVTKRSNKDLVDVIFIESK